MSWKKCSEEPIFLFKNYHLYRYIILSLKPEIYVHMRDEPILFDL